MKSTYQCVHPVTAQTSLLEISNAVPFIEKKTKKLYLKYKCQDPMNSLTLHQTGECQYSTSILKRRHKSENVEKFCTFDMTLLCKHYIIQL